VWLLPKQPTLSCHGLLVLFGWVGICVPARRPFLLRCTTIVLLLYHHIIFVPFLQKPSVYSPAHLFHHSSNPIPREASGPRIIYTSTTQNLRPSEDFESPPPGDSHPFRTAQPEQQQQRHQLIPFLPLCVSE